MDTRHAVEIKPGDAGEGVRLGPTGGAITLCCLAIISVSFIAPLIITLPQMLDAVASPAALVRETTGDRALQTAAGATPEGIAQEFQSAVATSAWLNSLEEKELAEWRRRYRD